MSIHEAHPAEDMFPTFRDSNGLPTSLLPSSSQMYHEVATASPNSRKSTRIIANRAAHGDTAAQLSLLPIADVEATLEELQLPDGKTSVLDRLRAPIINQAEEVRSILEYMADHAEDHAVSMALVWRFAKELEVWKSCTNPEWRTESSFLESLRGRQTVRICIEFGTSTDAARNAKIKVLNRNWGETWYKQICQKKLFSQEKPSPARLSKRQLGHLADISHLVDLDKALGLLEGQIRTRTATGSREERGLKAATTNHLLPCDLGAVALQLSEQQSPNTSSRRKDIADVDPSDEVLELRSSNGGSGLLPFENSFATSTNRAKAEFGGSRKSKARKPVTSSKRSGKGPDGSEARSKSRRRQKELKQCDHLNGFRTEDVHTESRDCEDEDREKDCATHSSVASAGSSETIGTKKRKHDDITSEESGPSREDISRAPVSDDEVPIRPTSQVDTEAHRSHITTRAATQANRPQQNLHLPEFDDLNTSQPQTNGPPNDTSYKDNAECNSQKTSRDLTDFPQLSGGGSTTRDELACMAAFSPPESDVCSLDKLIAAVADEHVLYPSDSGAASERNCDDCHGTCLLCEMSHHSTAEDHNLMTKFAHQAARLEAHAPNEFLQRWIRRIKYASRAIGMMQGNEDVYVLTSQSFLSHTWNGNVIDKPILLREQFGDTDDWSANRYAELLHTMFEDIEVDVRWHKDSEPKRERVSRMTRLCKNPSDATRKNPPNMLNLPDITGAAPPGFLRRDRFRLLDLLVERSKADVRKRCKESRGRGHIGKQIGMTPFDVGSCGRFNMLGWPGAFSGAHVDSTGATWVRNLCGYKLWMFVPRPDMTQEDWNRLSRDGDRWDPRDKARAVILGPGDVFVMPAGLVHAVLTIGDSEPCLMIGGFFWDDRDLLHILKTQYWIAQNQRATNELVAYQLAEIILALERVVVRNSKRYFANDGALKEFSKCINDLKSLGCRCDGCDNDCPCSHKDRRCTPFCAAHSFDATQLPLCMLET